MNNINKIIKNKLTIFLIQILIITLIISIFGYNFSLNFDSTTLLEQKIIIQILANHVMFAEITSLVFIYILWISVSLIPIFLFVDYKKSYSMNLTTFFFPNFFFYVFYSHHSPVSFQSTFPLFFPRTIILGFILVVFSFGLTYILKIIKKSKRVSQDKNLKPIDFTSKYTCPKCGTEFNSIPKYCYNCLNELNKDEFTNEK